MFIVTLYVVNRDSRCSWKKKLTLNSSGPICDNVMRKLWIDSSTFLSTSYCKEEGGIPPPPAADAGEDVLAILGYVKSNPSHSTSRGDTGPGDRILYVQILLCLSLSYYSCIKSLVRNHHP